MVPFVGDEESIEPASRGRFGKRLFALLVFLLPAAYVATLLAVIVHEVVGHGGTALLLGGQLQGFEVHWDAMGWARIRLPSGTTTAGYALHLAGGASATAFLGAALLGMALRLRKCLFGSMALAVASSAFVLDGSIYMFWSSWLPNPPGDFSRIIAMTSPSPWRWVFLCLGFTLTVVFAFFPMALVVRAAAGWVFDGRPVTAGRRATMPALIGTGYALGQVAFNWDQLVAGIGNLPRIAGVITGLAMAVALWYVPIPLQKESIPFNRAYGPMALSLGSLLALGLAMALWLTKGIPG